MVQDNSLGNEIVLSRIGSGTHARCALFGGDSVQIDDEEQERLDEVSEDVSRCQTKVTHR